MKLVNFLFISILLLFGQFAFAQDIRIIGGGNEAPIYRGIISTKLLQSPRYLRTQFSQVDVRVVNKNNQKYLVTFLKFKNVYQFETSIVSLKPNNEVSRVDTNTPLVEVNKLVKIFPGTILNLCPDSSVDIVFATPEDGIPSAVAGVENACLTAEAHGYKCKTLIGSEATVSAYKSYLSFCSGLKALGNIGHGNTGGILLYDGQVLNSDWFSSLSSNRLNNKVLYFNSCQVHNLPLEPAVMSAGTRTYIGGNINLGIGTSEEVFKCFWQESLTPPTSTMLNSIQGCENSLYPVEGAHGLSGATGMFKPLIIIPPPHLTPIPHL